MIFGGIFKIWSGGKAKARRIGIIQQQSLKVDSPDSEDDGTDNTTPGGPSDGPEPIDGVLALDRNGDGAIDIALDLNFENDTPGASSSLEGLEAFDTNNDGFINSSDTQWQNFGIWNDADGSNTFDTGEFETFEARGIVSFSLTASDNSYIYFQRQDGTEGILALQQSATFNQIPGT